MSDDNIITKLEISSEIRSSSIKCNDKYLTENSDQEQVTRSLSTRFTSPRKHRTFKMRGKSIDDNKKQKNSRNSILKILQLTDDTAKQKNDNKSNINKNRKDAFGESISKNNIKNYKVTFADEVFDKKENNDALGKLVEIIDIKSYKQDNYVYYSNPFDFIDKTKVDTCCSKGCLVF